MAPPTKTAAATSPRTPTAAAPSRSRSPTASRRWQLRARRSLGRRCEAVGDVRHHRHAKRLVLVDVAQQVERDVTLMLGLDVIEGCSATVVRILNGLVWFDLRCNSLADSASLADQLAAMGVSAGGAGGAGGFKTVAEVRTS